MNCKVDFDPSNLESMRALMTRYGGSNCYCGAGCNNDGEETTISIHPDCIEVITFQQNHHVRINTYHADGMIEETFDGTW